MPDQSTVAVGLAAHPGRWWERRIDMRMARDRERVGDGGTSPLLAYIMLGLIVGLLALFLIVRPR